MSIGGGNNMKGKLRLGLDIGTNSVGWSVVDENNELIKKNGKTLWGVRMFDEASSAEKRRLFRGSRIRLKRRNERMRLLREIFDEEIAKVDPTFYERLDDSFFKTEDKRHKNVHNLFVDEFTDKEFFNMFPTIYHLRSHLMNSTKKEDIRFIYLAIANMVKYRGNFLTPGDEFKSNDFTIIKDVFEKYNLMSLELSQNFDDFEDYFATIDFNNADFFDQFKEEMTKSVTKREKKKLLAKVLGASNKTLVSDYFIPLLVGSKVDLSKLLPVKDNGYNKCEVSVNIEDLQSKISDMRGRVLELDSLVDFLVQIKNVTDYYFIRNILGESPTLSDAMINKYNEHKRDLKSLKTLIKKYLPGDYHECFRSFGKTEVVKNTDDEKKGDTKEINDTYAHYISVNSINGKTTRISHAKREDFYDYVKKLLAKIKDPDPETKSEIDKICVKIDNNDYLLRQNSDQNGGLPMQLNLSEINKILNVQKEYYPFLDKVDDTGLSNIQKIKKIFKFKVPYYVGHLSDKGKNSWVVRKSQEHILPWNFDKVIDVEKTAEEFIHRMQRKCTYLKGEKDYCLPKNSIVFSEYNCLSYLNKLSVNGAPISVDVKSAIFQNVFLTKKKPTNKDIFEFIQSNYGDINLKTTKYKDLPEVTCDMSSYITFKHIFKDHFEENFDMIEEIIKDIVVFSDKDILEKRLKEKYRLNNEKIQRISCLSFSGYSNLCRNLLYNMKIINPKTGEKYGNVLDVMRNSNATLQQIMYDPEYRLIDKVDNYNKQYTLTSENLPVEEYIESNVAMSPIMKRPMIQAYRLIEEVEKIMGRPIDEYYIECTRTNKAKKKAVPSRYKNLKELYSSCKELCSQLNVDYKYINELLDENKDRLRSDKIYFYFTQLGKCMYTLENIDFDDILLNTKYDIDHIYPRALFKDDSLSNRVLSLKTKNSAKSDRFIFEIDGFLDPKCFAFYNLLREKGLITKEKYNRLTKKEIHPAELEGFVNRQMVATNQAIMGLIDVLKNYKGVDPKNIIYSKAENISFFRQKFDILKSRDANNFHHAHDAYLNVVVGGILNRYFSLHALYGYSDYARLKVEGVTINPENVFEPDFRKYKGQIIWDKRKTVTLLKKNILKRYDIMETVRAYNKGAMFGKTKVLPASRGNAVPLRQNGSLSDTSKYGGYTSYSYSKCVVIRVKKKNKDVFVLEAIPKIYEHRVEEYLTAVGYKNFEILVPSIRMNIVVREGKLKYCITGKSDSSYCIKNLNDRFFEYHFVRTIRKIEKFNLVVGKSVKNDVIEDKIVISPKGMNKRGNEIILEKKEVIDLIECLIRKYNLPLYSFSSTDKVRAALKSAILVDMPLQDLIKLSTQLLLLYKTNERKTVDLRTIGLKKISGSLRRPNVLSPGLQLIAESITGYYSKVLFEVPK